MTERLLTEIQRQQNEQSSKITEIAQEVHAMAERDRQRELDRAADRSERAELRREVTDIQLWRANMNGRQWMLGVGVSAMAGVVAWLVSIFLQN
ncbi:MAG: hypothetical protein AAF851_05630 [Myxococcota bacterium]